MLECLLIAGNLYFASANVIVNADIAWIWVGRDFTGAERQVIISSDYGTMVVDEKDTTLDLSSPTNFFKSCAQMAEDGKG